MSVTIDIGTLFGLHGRVAIVTGASSGLGARFARVLDAAGATVVLAARRQELLEQLATELERAVPVVCDVTWGPDRAAVVQAALDVNGRIDILVNNAGIGEPIPAEDEPLEHFEHVVDVNLNSLFALTQLVGREMIAVGRGSIVNIASILGLVASAPIKQASYAASKGAVVNLTRELAVQWARKGVRVNAIAPGWFPSEMTTAMFEDEASNAYLRRNAPMGRGGAEHELDGALLFLASDASSYVTGHTLVVDGGWTAR
ncbi:MAG: glucose 1-dehydrogenase [Acidimicrobiales bacterium]|nr:glucose 1-dehydrogenase [Acidimicrobiales bacterium]